MVILNVLVKNPPLDSEAGCFASTLNMTIRRPHFQSGVLAEDPAVDAGARSIESTLVITVCG
jgi:hypothetical protein